MSSTAKDEISDFSLRDAEVHLEITWVDRRCAFNAQHLFQQKKSTASWLGFPIPLTF